MENSIMITNFETGENIKMTHDQIMFLIDSMIDYKIFLENREYPAEKINSVNNMIMDLVKIS